MVRRFKVKTRGGKVVSRKRVKSFKSSSKKKTEQQQVEAAKKALEQIKKAFEKKGVREEIIKQVKRSSAKRAVKKVSEAFAQPGVRAKIIKQTQQIATKRRQQPTLSTQQKRKIQEIIPFKSKSTLQQRREIKKVMEEKEVIDKKRGLEIVKDAPKDVAVGLFEVGKEIVVLAGKSVKGSFNYGRGLAKRFAAGENTPLKNDIIKLGTGVINVSTFVKNKPKESAAIVGLAVASGGSQFGSAFSRNPVKTTTKAIAYLFPGTVIKGGVKVVGLGTRGVKTVAQAKRLQSLSKPLNVALQGSLSTSQTNKLSKAIKGASVIGNAAKREAKVKGALKVILKERGFKPTRGASVSQLAKNVKSSKVLPIKVKVKQPRKPTVKLDKPVKVKKTRDKAKFAVVKGKAVVKVTKKEFTKLTKPKKIIKQDITKLAQQSKIKLEKARALELSQKGIIKQGGTTFIDLNAVKRIESATAPVKPIKLGNWGKKGQVRFNRDISVQITKQSKKVKKLKKIKNPKQLKKVKKDLTRLKTIIKAGGKLIVKAPLFIAAIDSLLASINAQSKAQTPALAQPQAKKPGQAQPQAQKPGQAQPQAQTPGQLKKLATPQSQKPILKNIFKPRPIKKKPVAPIKPVKWIKLRLPSGLKKQGTRQAYIIKIKKGNKVIKQTVEGLPKVRATNLLRKILDTTPQTTGNLVSKGKTSILDTNKQILSKKFRMKKTKNTKTLQIVEKKKFRTDNVGEKTKKVKVIKKKTSKSITSKKKSSQKPSKKLKAKSKGKKAPTSKVNKKRK